MKLWGQDFNPRVKKIQVAASYAGLDIPICEIDESKRKEYLKKNPTGFIPALEIAEGSLSESNSILRYIARSSKGRKLYGTSIFEEALINQWMDWSLSELEPSILAYSAAYLGYAPHVKEIHTKAKSDMQNLLKVLNEHLRGKKYLVGGTVSIADISLASTLNFAFQWLFDEKYRQSISNVTNWYQEVANQDEWKKVYGKTILCRSSLNVYTGSLDETA